MGRMKRRLGLLTALVALFVVVAVVNRDSLGFVMARARGSSATVDAARARLQDVLPALFAAQGVSWPPQEIFLRAIKENDDGTPGIVELWARAARERTRGAAANPPQDKDSRALTLIKTYPICAASGILGPKRRQGDLQVPEGFYTISKLNPQSSYHLSLRVDYPNASDRIRGEALSPPRGDLGGDIMVHGSCVTIGCIPLQDEPIEEVYLAADAVFPKSTIPIHIFPRRLDDAGLQRLLATTTNATLQGFWRELAVGWRAFESGRVVPAVTVGKDGSYVIAPDGEAPTTPW